MEEWMIRSNTISLAFNEVFAGVDAFSPDPDDSFKRKGWKRLREYFHIAAPGAFSDSDVINLNGNIPDWCGIFALWALKRAGAFWLGNWRRGHGIGEIPGMLPVKNPLPGDVGYFEAHQHMNIIYTVNGNSILTIDGNTDNKKAGNFRGGLVFGPNPCPKYKFKGFLSAFPSREGPAVVGVWRVAIGAYAWIYEFFGNFTCQWRGAYTSESGDGTWSVLDEGLVQINWKNNSVERWSVPLDFKKQKGQLVAERGCPVVPPTPIIATRIDKP